MAEPLMTRREVEEYLNCGRYMLDRLIRDGRLRPVNLNEKGALRVLRFRRQEVESLTASREQKGT